MLSGILIERLAEDSVSILAKSYIEYQGVKYEVGDNHRKAYVNSTRGRAELANEVAEPYLSSIMAVWGSKPTVVEEDRPQ